MDTEIELREVGMEIEDSIGPEVMKMRVKEGRKNTIRVKFTKLEKRLLSLKRMLNQVILISA